MMKKALIGLIKLAMDAQWTDEDIAKILKEAEFALKTHRYYEWSQK